MDNEQLTRGFAPGRRQPIETTRTPFCKIEIKSESSHLSRTITKLPSNNDFQLCVPVVLIVVRNHRLI